MTFLRTAVERASGGVHKLLRTGGVPTSLTFIVLAVADGGLFGLFGLSEPERRDEIFIGVRPHSSSVPNKPYSVDVKHHNYLLFLRLFSLSFLFFSSLLLC